MENRTLFTFVGIFIVAVLVATWDDNVSATKQPEIIPQLTVKVESEKKTYVLGEMVKLRFDLVNTSDDVVSLPYSPDVSTGFLKIWIARVGQRFNLYRNTSWGLRETGGPTIQPGQSFNSRAAILWNSKPDLSRLNLDRIENSPEGAILSDYAFPATGTYLVKAIISIPDNVSQNSVTEIESEPIQININEPVGDDLGVWEEIKNRSDIAYFIQQAGAQTYKDEKATKLVEDIEKIVQKYPEGLLVEEMKRSLAKFLTAEEKSTEALEKARIKPKN